MTSPADRDWQPVEWLRLREHSKSENAQPGMPAKIIAFSAARASGCGGEVTCAGAARWMEWALYSVFTAATASFSVAVMAADHKREIRKKS